MLLRGERVGTRRLRSALLTLALVAGLVQTPIARSEGSTGVGERSSHVACPDGGKDGLSQARRGLCAAALSRAADPHDSSERSTLTDILDLLREDPAAPQVRKVERIFADPVPDMTSDRHREVVQTDVYTRVAFDPEDPESFDIHQELALTALDGKRGQRMWEFEIEADNGFIHYHPARLGKQSRPGILVTKSEGIMGLSSLKDFKLTVVAVAGRSGKVLWKRVFEGDDTSVESPSGETLVGYGEVPVVGDGIDALPGRSKDVLVALATIVGPPAPVPGTNLQFISDVRVVVVDGKNGQLVEHTEHHTAVNWIPLPQTAHNDLSEDRLEDYVVPNVNDAEVRLNPDEPGAEPQARVGDVLKARSGRDGRHLWTADGFEWGPWVWVFPTGRLTNDLMPDVLVSTPDGDRESIVYDPTGLVIGYPEWEGFRTYLVDGLLKEILWHKAGGWPYSPGDISGDGVADVITFDGEFEWPKHAKLSIYAYSSPDGKRIYRRSLKVEFVKAAGVDISQWGAASYAAGNVGDLQPDGTDDIESMVDASNEAGTRYKHMLLNGRTSKTMHNVSRTPNGVVPMPLLAAVDGSGDDLVHSHWDKGSFVVTPQTGRERDDLWSSRVDLTVPFDPHTLNFRVTAATMDEDRCADLVVVASSGRGVYLVLLDGGDGSLLWSKALDGPDAGTKVTPSADRNHTC